MYQPYLDILDKLGKPLWWDENGVPRYDKFDPSYAADIYASYVALLEIRCQGCGELFPVASSWGLTKSIHPGYPGNTVWDADGRNPKPAAGLPKEGDAGYFSYGDAPWHTDDRQCSGTTMSTYTERVLEFWYREVGTWKRLKEHEVEIRESKTC